MGDIEAVEERLAYVQEVEAKLKSLGDKSELYASREELFGMPQTEYPQLAAINKAFEPYGHMVGTGLHHTHVEYPDFDASSTLLHQLKLTAGMCP